MPNFQPDFAQLLAYAVGELDDSDMASVERAIAASPLAQADLARIRTILQTMRTDDSVAPPDALVRRIQASFESTAAERPGIADAVRRVLGRLVFDSRAELALAGFRGVEDSFQLSFESEVASLDLECDLSGDPNRPTWSIIGQVESDAGVGGLNATLYASGSSTPVARTVTDEHGVFRAELGAGAYDLHLEFPGQVVVFSSVDLS